MARDLKIHPRSENLALVVERIGQISQINKAASPDNPRRAREQELMSARRSILRNVQRTIAKHSSAETVLFVSYSGLGTALAEAIRVAAKEFDFEIRTGFDSEVDQGFREDTLVEHNLPQAIISQIASSDFFLGIWTREFEDARGRAVPSVTGGMPSVWMPFELGVAAALGLPFRQLVEKGMHPLYCEKPFNTTAGILFDASNFHAKLHSALKYFDMRRQKRQGLYS